MCELISYSSSEPTSPPPDIAFFSLPFTLSVRLLHSISDFLRLKRSGGPLSHDSSGSDGGSQTGSNTSEYSGIPFVHSCLQLLLSPRAHTLLKQCSGVCVCVSSWLYRCWSMCLHFFFIFFFFHFRSFIDHSSTFFLLQCCTIFFSIF